VHDAFQDRTRVEPQLVANLVSALPKYVNRISFSGPTKMKAGGVFVHAQPFVACASFPDKTKASVEIGDLLLIRTLVVNNKIEERRALLLQAKKDRIPSTPDNPNQWHLYEQWPRFTYAAKSGRLTGKKRHINEPDMYEAAKYLLIGDDAARHHRRGMCCVDWPFRWLKHGPDICGHHTAQPTKPHISRYRCFVGELVEFLAGNAGKVFDKPASRTRGWNRVVHDLITETARAKTIFMGRAAQTSIKYPRGSGVLFMALAAQSRHFMVAGGGGAEVFDGTTHEPPDVPEHWLSDSDRDGGGISIIEVVIEDEGPARD
jgi:hypothetical protein